MKQIVQNYKSGELQLVEVPDPIIRSGGVILQTVNSLISVGTEKLMIELAQKGYLGKALARPDLKNTIDWFKENWDNIERSARFGPGASSAVRSMVGK